MSTPRVMLSAATSESLALDVRCTADPTGTPPGWALTPIGTYATPTTVFVDGAWAGVWTPETWLVARTPTLVAGTIPVPAGASRWVWIRVEAGDEVAVWLAGSIVVA